MNASIRRNRRRLGVVLAALTLALVSAHGAMAGDHMGETAMGGMPAGDMSMGGVPVGGGDAVEAAMTMCLAIAGTGALALGAAALAFGARCLRALDGRLAWPLAADVLARAVRPRARARPPDLAALQVLRI